jgi:hypothetical protein
MMLKFELDFHPASEEPTKPGDYLLYNQCDGYHVVEAHFYDDGEFDGFYFFASAKPVSADFYRAWALLPDSVKTMYDAFAKKDEDAPAYPAAQQEEG